MCVERRTVVPFFPCEVIQRLTNSLGPRVQRSEGFVEHQDRRVVDGGSDERDFLLHTLRERADQRVGLLFEREVGIASEMRFLRRSSGTFLIFPTKLRNSLTVRPVYREGFSGR